uniref:Uncharacterized protein n=1 Tax=Arion vulgaris TaxID=1028688 RepID=A0A0B6ZRD3_9EUPU
MLTSVIRIMWRLLSWEIFLHKYRKLSKIMFYVGDLETFSWKMLFVSEDFIQQSRHFL